ncbi:MAG TPA: DUF47 family protein [Candidatus Eremiobacteraeota bacterium]|nr:DUF47 family protein [Candidatus Eremiobacteraeota bacterium]
MSILKPKDEIFFNLFDKQAKLNCEATQIFKDVLESFPDLEKIKILKELGDTGNKLRAEIAEALENSFITPFEPEDIHSISIYLDKYLGRLYSAAMRIKLYKVNLADRFKDYTLQLTDTMMNSAEEILEGINLLRKRQNAVNFVHKIKELEQEGDIIQREATASLFDGSVGAIEIIKWKEIYEQMESAIDLCEDISHLIDNIIIKHA